MFLLSSAVSSCLFICDCLSYLFFSSVFNSSYRSVYNCAAFSCGSATHAIIFCGISTASSFKASPFGVMAAINTRSSSSLRVRVTYPFCSNFFKSGVSVPESKNRHLPSSLTLICFFPTAPSWRCTVYRLNLFFQEMVYTA